MGCEMSDMTDHTVSSGDGPAYTLQVFTKEETRPVGGQWNCTGKTVYRASEGLRLLMIWAGFFFVIASASLLMMAVLAFVWFCKHS